MVERIEIGKTPDDGTGESLRSAFEKVNANFAELAAALARASASAARATQPNGGWPGEWVARHLADGPPQGTPPLLGALWVDVTAQQVWISTGTAASTDWRRLMLERQEG
ncbi:hypothetical protein SAMN05877809_101386 [Rhodobacter sp. JA431]|uniref:hypothetical protein n=1 Tax=Rhodobacter sp. JA431 TaxID=570013 RepID=UPI000BCDD776|nr:hypothetical protein [Rhodobacter sp. JA431]SOB91581.1 hypothetical protein SAMN05877809_101386 [Rhodobacter sp. JA431]